MDQFGKVIEVFLNANEILCFVWVTSTYIDSFDKLLNAYSEIGNALPGLQQYSASFESYQPLSSVLEDYYSDILNFHRVALSVFARPKWKSIFKAAWKTFETELGPIITSLASRRALLESEKASASLYEINNIREKISSVYQEQQCQARIHRDERHRTYMREIKVKLQSPEYQINQEISTENRGESQSGQWIFKHSKFEPWYDSSTLGSMVLYINGIPGAGKTTLMSTIIERLLREKRLSGSGTSVVYFYFKHSSKTRQSGQLFDDISDIEGENLRKTERLQHLVKEAPETSRISFLVVDGLDECPKEETEQTVKWLLSILEEQSAGSTLRIIFSGQRDGVLDRLLKSYPSISLDVSTTPAHTQDINHYCAKFCTRIQEEFDMSPELQHEILRKVIEGARDMFLYARVVLHNLMNQATLSDLRKELQPGTFPKGIEDAYTRVVTRVLEGPVPRQKRILQLLGLIVAAQRPLRWREIQGFFCIDSTLGEIDYENKRLRKSCKDLCGALVDVHRDTNESSVSEDLIRIVHPTAKSYLIQKHIINLSLEHARLSRFCSEYLTSRPFKAGIGYEQNWYHHAGYFIEVFDKLDISTNNSSFKSLRALLVSFLAQVPDTVHSPELEFTYTIELYKTLAKDDRERNSQIEMELRATLIRQQISRLYQNESISFEGAIGQLYEPKLTLKCHKSWCSYFTGGFYTTEEQHAHLARHERLFYCPQEGCFASSLGFASESLLEKHRTAWHRMKSDPAQFPKRSRKTYGNLHAAVVSGDIDAVEFGLVSQSLTAEPNTEEFKTSLLYTARKGDTAMCRLLMSHAAIDTSSILFREVLVAATVKGNLETVKLFGPQLGDGIGRECGRHVFLRACDTGHLATAKFLYDTCGCENHLNPRVFHYCVLKNDMGMLKYLLENGFANFNDPDLIMGKILRYDPIDNRIFELFLDTGRARPCLEHVSLAIERGAIKPVEMLLSYGVKFDDIEQIKLVYQAFAAGSKNLMALITNTTPVFNLPPLLLFEPLFDLENIWQRPAVHKLAGCFFSQVVQDKVNQLAKKAVEVALKKQKDFNRRRLHQELDDPTIAEFQSQGKDILECFYRHQAFRLLQPTHADILHREFKRMGRDRAMAYLIDKT
ncbi:uncharacterized protein FTOL_08571 [Fusarium torulosum]|uniref:NACHT domain-containing protein n=1 Tax=Fusarium torulosum TaxID=33205 RepID=A0AAE8MCZ6_9HYPO|nr:uncharacterized protein FTOL_08571 [Fusarium torulosum]